MSFLNPVNEPVLRFSSTDAGAPQINYNARVAGDVKAVLKACLVTGYGAVASAGWSAVNETGNVIEFVSPSAAMSDYRLGIDDASTSSTTWYYQDQDVRTDPSPNKPVKSFGNIYNTHGDNGWRLFATDRGVLFVELVQHSSANKLSARITYFGAVKSGLTSVNGKNICFFSIGHNTSTTYPCYFYDRSGVVQIQLEQHTSVRTSAATSNALSGTIYILDTSSVDLISPIYLASNSTNMLIAELPPLLSKVVNATADVYGVSEFALDNRNVMSVCAGYPHSTMLYVNGYARTFLIRTDYWEY